VIEMWWRKDREYTDDTTNTKVTEEWIKNQGEAVAKCFGTYVGALNVLYTYGCSKCDLRAICRRATLFYWKRELTDDDFDEDAMPKIVPLERFVGRAKKNKPDHVEHWKGQDD